MRPPAHVMRLAQMGAMFPTRLSFLRVLLRDLAKQKARLERTVWRMNSDGYGHAVYSISLGGYDYSLVAVSQSLPDDQRTDRVIATAWDSTFVLYDGRPSKAEIARICAAAPKQEAARFTERDLILSRANKSQRLWSEIVEGLRAGTQPSLSRVNDVGYLMRTTAVYGNGKFGIADRGVYANRTGLSGPFAAEMLTVWMIRCFTHDLLEHCAGAPLASEVKRHLGIGNATGLGMAPFLANHPVLLNNWMHAREEAFARVRAVQQVTPTQSARLLELACRALRHLSQWAPSDAGAAEGKAKLAGDAEALLSDTSLLSEAALQHPFALDRLARAAAEKGPECEELVLALLVEPFGEIVDDIAVQMADESHSAPGPIEALPMTSDLARSLSRHAAWATGKQYTDPADCARYWYVSAEKLEPRIGLRQSEDLAAAPNCCETPLDIARRFAALAADIPQAPMSTSAFLEEHPRHLMAVERLLIARRNPYANIQDNLIADTCRPIDMLRAKLAMFGATKFDPKSDLWTRITLAQGAPLPEDLTGEDAITRGDDWWLPVVSEAGS